VCGWGDDAGVGGWSERVDWRVEREQCGLKSGWLHLTGFRRSEAHGPPRQFENDGCAEGREMLRLRCDGVIFDGLID